MYNLNIFILNIDDVICNLFQYDGEIQVLYQVTIIQTLNNKKWGGKDLPVKAGEKLDVIVKAVDNKLICRNEDGKSEYQLLQFWFKLINTCARDSCTTAFSFFAPQNWTIPNLKSVCLWFTVGYVSTSHIDME